MAAIREEPGGPGGLVHHSPGQVVRRIAAGEHRIGDLAAGEHRIAGVEVLRTAAGVEGCCTAEEEGCCIAEEGGCCNAAGEVEAGCRMLAGEQLRIAAGRIGAVGCTVAEEDTAVNHNHERPVIDLAPLLVSRPVADMS